MRRFISLLSAAAVAASSFAAIGITAFADDEVLFTDNFNKYENTIAHNNESVGYVFLTGAYEASCTSKDIAGITLYTTARADDSSYYQFIDKDEDDKYIQTQTSRFARQGAGAHIDFDTTYAAEEGKDVVLAFKLKETNDGETTYDDVFTVGGAMINAKTAEINDGEWHDIKVVATTSGLSVYADGGSEAIATASDTSISMIKFNSYIDGVIANDAQKAASNPFGYPTWGFDDMVVYTSADGAASIPPEAGDNTDTPATPEPTAEPPAEITDTVTVDFDNTDFDAAGITVTKHQSYTTVEVAPVEGGLGDNETSVYKVDQTSSKTTSYGFATIDFSAVTSGKSHVVIDYDIYVGSNGRLKVIFGEGALSGSNSDTLGSLFTQGITKGGDTGTNCRADAWVHTKVDVDLASGTGTYTVTNPDESAVSSGKITTDIGALTTMSLVSWSPNTSYLDNIVIGTGGDVEVVTPSPDPTTSPEPASEVEGSFESKALAPSNDWSTDFTAVEGEGVVILNHSNANPLAAGSVNVYEDNVNYRGKSIYALYDVLVNAGDKLTLELYNKTDLGTTFTLTGNDDGTATAAAKVNKGDNATVGNVVCGTWYRVLIEVPQINNDGATNTGDATYTIYRIDPADPTKVSEVAAAKAGLTPRNLSGKAMTTLKFSAEGTPYIDNGVAFVKGQGYELELPDDGSVWRLYTAEKNADGDLISVTAVIVDDPASVTLGENQYLWNQYQTPYK